MKLFGSAHDIVRRSLCLYRRENRGCCDDLMACSTFENRKELTLEIWLTRGADLKAADAG
jgi:hypothetical protein